MARYDYQELREKLNGKHTQDDVNALGEWLSQYGDDSWNGEYYDADGLKIFPVYNQISEDEFDLVGYEIK
jgi:hypothetical protein